MSNLDAETGLAPVPPLGVVSVVCVEKERHLLAHFVPTEFCMWWLDLICGARSCYKFISGNLIRRTDIYDSDRGASFSSKYRDRMNEIGNYLPDGVTGPEANPLGDRTVLLLSFGKLLLGTEGLVALQKISNVSYIDELWRDMSRQET